MENYKKLVRDLIEQNINEYITWNEGATRADAVKHMAENGFGDLFDEISEEYFGETLKRGAEVFDVVICELVANGVLYEIASAEGVEL